MKRRFLHESGDYGELETGATTLAFASLALGRMNLPAGYVAACESHQPLGFEVARVTPAVEHMRKPLRQAPKQSNRRK